MSNETRRLLEKNGVCNGSIQIGTFDVKMVNGPTMHSCHRNNQLHCAPFDDWSESFLVIQAFMLTISASDKPGFELGWCAYSFGLELVHPLYWNCTVARRQINQSPNVVRMQRGHLLLHSCNPVGICDGVFVEEGLVKGDDVVDDVNGIGDASGDVQEMAVGNADSRRMAERLLKRKTGNRVRRRAGARSREALSGSKGGARGH
jgi:hypothetical protein